MDTPRSGHTAQTRDNSARTTAPAKKARASQRKLAQPPAWRHAFNRAEVIVGRPLESVTNSPDAAAVLIITDRLTRKVFRQIDAFASWGIHQLHMPSHRDLRMLQRQLSAIQRQLSDVQATLYAAGINNDGPQP
jgi:hypothetical protein